MTEDVSTYVTQEQQSVSIRSAKQLSITNNTLPQIPTLTPRWFLKLLPWINVESGIYRVNRVKFVSGITKIPIPEDLSITPQLLKHIRLFDSLPDDVLASICSKMEQKSTRPGEAIETGKKTDRLYIVLDGQYDAILQGRYGKNLVIKTFDDGDYFGDVGAQTKVVSTTHGKLIYLDISLLKKIIKDSKSKQKIENDLFESSKSIELASQYVEMKPPLMAGHFGEPSLPHGYVEYSEEPLEVHLNVIQTIIGVHTRINDLYNVPYNQLQQQLKIAIEHIHEREEWELINNENYGLLHTAEPFMTMNTRNGPPTPDDLDDLLSKVWKKPTVFLAHPKAIAAFTRECTYRGVPPVIEDILGSKFVTWRGIPLIPSDKLKVRNDKGTYSTDILLMRLGEADQGVVGLHKDMIGAHSVPSLSIQHMGINEQSVSNYLLTKYSAAAVLVPDALAVLKRVEIGSYPHYD